MSLEIKLEQNPVDLAATGAEEAVQGHAPDHKIRFVPIGRPGDVGTRIPAGPSSSAAVFVSCPASIFAAAMGWVVLPTRLVESVIAGSIVVVAPDKRAAAPDITGTTLDGSAFRLADHRGEVVVMNVWASWCAPCAQEASEVRRTRRRGPEVSGCVTRVTLRRALTFSTKSGGCTMSSTAPPNTPLIYILRNDLDLKGTRFGCGEGVCGTCEVKVLEGLPDHRDHFLTDADKAGNRSIMVCCSGSKSSRLVLDI